MKKFEICHVVICRVHAWRTIEANNYEDALTHAAAIQHITDSGSNYEIVDDEAVKQITIREIQS